MTSVRLVLIRGSLILNALLVLYLCMSWLSVAPTKKTLAKSINFEQFDGWGDIDGGGGSSPLRKTLEQKDASPKSSGGKSTEAQEPPPPIVPTLKITKPEAASQIFTGDRSIGLGGGEYQEPPREVQERAGAPEPPMVVAPLVEEGPDPPLDSLERKMYGDLRDCPTKPVRTQFVQKGDYWILNNYIPAAMSFRCDESITYATHGDYTFLDNLDPLTSRWQGPVSVAVYAPGDDFQATIDTILYLRNCMAEGVKKYVTFHLYFHTKHIPKEIPTVEQLLGRKTDCVKDPPRWSNVTTYRQAKKLDYPVNVARNTARLHSQTYFNFVSDVELYPSINFIPDFFKMLKKPDRSNTTSPRVFVFPIFEVSDNQNAPETKVELQKMIKAKTSIPFHKKICTKCHNQPKSKEWQAEIPKSGLSIFFVGTRQPPFNRWEPIYVGTDKEPIYDERLSWEGKSDKMTQMYILCVRNYEFHILDNAFLVHKPGIKLLHKEPSRDRIVAKQNNLIRKTIIPEYKILFGQRKGCAVI